MSRKSGSEVELTLRYDDEETAKTIIDSVLPDNYKIPEGLELGIKQEKTDIIFRVRCTKGIGSLISTIDDILRCIDAAEKTLNGIS